MLGVGTCSRPSAYVDVRGQAANLQEPFLIEADEGD